MMYVHNYLLAQGSFEAADEEAGLRQGAGTSISFTRVRRIGDLEELDKNKWFIATLYNIILLITQVPYIYWLWLLLEFTLASR